MVIAAAEIIHCVCIHCKLFQLHTAGGEENTADAAGFLRADGDTAHTGNTAVRIGLEGESVSIAPTGHSFAQRPHWVQD